MSSRSFGYSIAMNAAGTTLAVGAPGMPSGMPPGEVIILRQDELQPTNWQADMDMAFNDEAIEGDKIGDALSLSHDGDVLAIGTSRRSAGATNGGQVRVWRYQEDGGLWSPHGDDINGAAENQRLGAAVSLSSGGDQLAVGASGHGGGGSEAGACLLYELSAGEWVEQFVGLGLAQDDNFGVRRASA